MRPPRAARHLVELLPITFVPSGHTNLLYVLLKALDAASVQKVHRGSLLRLSPGRLFYARAIHIHQRFLGEAFSLPVVSNTLRGDLFRVFPAELANAGTQRSTLQKYARDITPFADGPHASCFVQDGS